MELEKQAVAGLLTGELTPYDFFDRSDLRSKYFEDEFCRYAVRKIEQLYKDNLEINFTTLKTTIDFDRDLESKKKPVYKAVLKNLKGLELDSVHFSVNELRKSRDAYVANETLTKMVYSLRKDGSVEDLLEIAEDLKRLKTTDFNFEILDFNTEEALKQRQARAIEDLLNDNSKKLTFFGYLAWLASIFPFLESKTITTVGGTTGEGKSILLQNMAYQATHPNNGLNVLFIGAENKLSQIENRFDAIFQDRPYELFKERSHKDEESVKFYQEKEASGDWGILKVVKLPPKKFTSLHIEEMLELLKTQGTEIDVLCIDSPDHMTPLDKKETTWLDKEEVYWDIKFLMNKYNLICLTTIPLKGSAGKKKYVDTEDTAGAVAIARIIDNGIYFIKNTEERLVDAKVRNLQPTKQRDDAPYTGKVKVKISNSLRFCSHTTSTKDQNSSEEDIDNLIPKGYGGKDVKKVVVKQVMDRLKENVNSGQ